MGVERVGLRAMALWALFLHLSPLSSPYLNRKGWEKSLLGPHFTALVAWQGILWEVAPALYYHPRSTGLLSNTQACLLPLTTLGL